MINYIQHLNSIFKQFDNQENLRAYHISLYLALFRSWNEKLFPEKIFFYRSDMMKRSKITSPSKYHRAIKELHLWNFIVYGPSKNAIRGSSVVFVSPEHRIQNMMLGSRSKKERISRKESNKRSQEGSITEPVHPNMEQGSAIIKHAEPDVIQENPTKEHAHANVLHVTPRKELPPIINGNKTYKTFKTPGEKEIIDFFRSHGWCEIQALKFCSYYDSIGWKKGTAPITNWYSAAKNWMLNSAGPSGPSGRGTKTTDSLQVTKEKDYGKPL